MLVERYLVFAFAAFALIAIPITQNFAAGYELDNHGVQEIYPTKTGGQEWYVNSGDPRSDLYFKNLDNLDLIRNGDSSWHVYADQVRMEAWSHENDKWLNVEITEYAKIVGGSDELLQLYSRGGHHSDNNQCEGSAYKARLYGDGTAAWTKEVTHPAYAENRGLVQATTTPLEGRWVGFKAVIYNFVEDGNTYVRLESYIDDDVTDPSGNLVVGNNWKLASVVEDRGGWATTNSDFNPNCSPADKDSTDQYRQRDEILSSPGGTTSQNIVGFRTDEIGWDFEYLSVREIQPPVETPAEPQEPPTVDQPEVPPVDDGTQLPPGYLVSSSSIAQDGDMTAQEISLMARKVTTRTTGDMSVAIMQGDKILAVGVSEASALDTVMQQVSIPIKPATISGSYQIAVYFYGSGYIQASNIQAVT